MNFFNQFLWVIYPYIMFTLFIIVHIYRYNTDQINWSAKSSEFLEKKSLKWGSILFHYGILLAFGGHFVGLIIPISVTEKLGITEGLYHASAVILGSIAGILTLIGTILLLLRRTTNKRIRITSSFADILIIVLLFLVVGIGVYNTIGYNLVTENFNYRESLAPWLRGLFTFQPNPELMIEVPLVFQIHTLLAFTTLGVWPFTRLVHILSAPLTYPTRRYILYRSLGKKNNIE
ncbi:MAG: respiratory nitrate reductase subunit gamma [Vulcanibacillus sp.]